MKSILIVDDDMEVIDLVKNRLEANNYYVIISSNGKEAIKLAQEQKPDLIIMDILMPEMSGGDVVQHLRSDNKTKHIPIIFLTAMSTKIQPGPENKNINVNGQLYPAIVKPYDPANLLFEIEKLIGDG